MIFILYIVLLILGFVLVIKGADFLVNGASSLAQKFNISSLVIGLTVVAFGTSAPELVVNIVASLNDHAEIAIGNILGSNIANIFLILGVASLICPLAVTKGTVWKEIPLGLLAALLIGFMANDFLIDGKSFSALTRIDGLVLLSFFIIFMYYTFGIGKNNGANQNGELEIKSYKLWKSILLVLAGLIALTLGGKLIVDNAVALATALGVSASLIGLTVVAFGTSVPELATSVVAAYKKNVDIAVGNVIGSNIFNLFWVLGASSLISPLPFQMRSNIDILVVVFANLLLFAFMFIGKKRILEKSQGTMFIFLYAVYIAITIIQK